MIPRPNIAKWQIQAPWKEFAQITVISVTSLVPFIAIEYYYDYGVVLTALIGFVYLLIVAVLEMRYDLLPIDNSVLKPWINTHLEFLKRKLEKAF